MERELELLRRDWAEEMYGNSLDRRNRLIYELFLLLEKMVAMLGDHENQLNHVHRVPGGEDEKCAS